MRTIGNILVIGLVGYFTIVPPSLNKTIETIQYSQQTIDNDNYINSKITMIQEEKDKIYNIQKELDSIN